MFGITVSTWEVAQQELNKNMYLIEALEEEELELRHFGKAWWESGHRILLGRSEILISMSDVTQRSEYSYSI